MNPATPRLCYGSQDESDRLIFCMSTLERRWIDPWLDVENLLPGENREEKLEEALKSTDIVLLFLSNQIFRAGGSRFHQEIDLVYRFAKEKLSNSIFVIPVRLDDCEI